MSFNYRPQRSCSKVMFLHLSVILFTGGSGRPPGQTPPWADTPPSPRQTPPWADNPSWNTHPIGQTTPLEQTHPPSGSRHPQADTPWEQTHPQEQTPPKADTPPCAVHAGRYGQQAGGSYWNTYLFYFFLYRYILTGKFHLENLLLCPKNNYFIL